MSWRKKKRTYVSAGTDELVDINAYDKSRGDLVKEAVKRYIFDKGDDLSKYLIQARQSAPLYDRWEELYHYVSKNPDGVNHAKDVNYPQDEYYPIITIMRDGAEQINNPTCRKRLEILSLNPDEINAQIKNAIGNEWGNMRLVALHLGAPFREETVVEYPNQLGVVAYAYKYFSQLAQRTPNIIAQVEDALTRIRTEALAVTFRDGFGVEIPYGNYPNFSNGGYEVQGGVPKMVREMYIPLGGYASVLLPSINRVLRRPDNEYIYDPHDDYIYRPPDDYIYQSEYICLAHRGIDGRIQCVGVRISESFEIMQRINESFEVIEPRKNYSIPDEASTWVVPTWYRNYNYNEDLDGVVLPINRKLLAGFSKKEKERIIQQSLRVSWVHAKTVKEYRSWVKPFLRVGAFVLAAVITVKSFGTGAKLGAAILKAATSIAVGVAINKIVDFAVKIGIISPKVATIIKLVAQLTMIAKGVGWDFSKILTAPNIMKAVNLSFDYYNRKKAWEMQEVQKQQDEHNRMHQSRMEALAAKQKMADLGVASDPNLYLGMPSFAPSVNLFETPEMMYARHYNFNVVNISHGLIFNLANGLKYRQVDRVKQVRDITQEIEDVLLIT